MLMLWVADAYDKEFGPGARRFPFVSLSLAPLVKVGAPAFSICHAFAGPLGPALSLAPLGTPRFPIIAVALMFVEFPCRPPWGPGVFHLSRFRWPPWPGLSLIPWGPRRFPFVAVALMFS